MSSPSHPAGAAARGRRRRVALLLALPLLLLAAAVTAFVKLDLQWSEVSDVLARVNRPLALLIMATLPIVGFPVSAMYLAAGALFGPALGGVVVAGATTIHLLATHLLARTLLRERIARWRERWRHRIPAVPEGEYATLIAMTVIVPGPPYFVRNCLLALSGAPLRHLLGVGVPLYVARSYVTIFLGDLGNDPSLGAVAVLGLVLLTKLAISALLYRRLRRHVRGG